MGFLKSVLEKILLNKNRSNNNNNLERISEIGYKSLFTISGNGIYDNVVARKAVDTIATHVSKLDIKHLKRK